MKPIILLSALTIFSSMNVLAQNKNVRQQINVSRNYNYNTAPINVQNRSNVNVFSNVAIDNTRVERNRNVSNRALSNPVLSNGNVNRNEIVLQTRGGRGGASVPVNYVFNNDSNSSKRSNHRNEIDNNSTNELNIGNLNLNVSNVDMNVNTPQPQIQIAKPAKPEIKKPAVVLPKIEKPQVELPKVSKPELKLPVIEKPEIQLPKVQKEERAKEAVIKEEVVVSEVKAVSSTHSKSVQSSAKVFKNKFVKPMKRLCLRVTATKSRKAPFSVDCWRP